MKSIGCLLAFAGLLWGGNGRTAMAAAPVIVKKLRCEYASRPKNIDRPRPRFSWILDSSRRGQKQTAYRVLVASSEKRLAANRGDCWDSGRIATAQTTHVSYQGQPLGSNTCYFWKVFVWDKDGQRVVSRPTEFWTALLTQRDWTARWIGAGPTQEPRPAAGFFQSVKEPADLADAVPHNGRSVLLRHTFHCGHEVKNARLFVTGLGYYELYLNGDKVGDHVLAPAKMNYRKQVLYDTFDVTDQLATGTNALGIHLGNGWFNPYKKWWRPYRMQWFGAKRAILQLHITYANGKTEVVGSDASWKQAPGPVLFNCVYDGELYDARCEQTGWASPEFDDSEWQSVNLVETPAGRLLSHRMQPIKVTDRIQPVAIRRPVAGVRVYDMGQNFAGWARISVQGARGTRLVMRFAEDVNEDGTIDVTSNEHAKATATYLLKGEGVEIYEPRFTFFGFRYVEVSGAPELPVIKDFQGCVVHSACPPTGTFACANPVINQIHRATSWSQRSNMMGYPMDCPQRDERLGWLGDAQVTAEEVMFNWDAPLFFANWLSGIRENQDEATGDLPIISPRPYIRDEGVEWSSTYILLLWKYYLYYGDTAILADHYPAAKRYLDFLGSQAKNHRIKAGWIGDWGSLVEGWQEGEPASVPTGFYYWDAVLMARIATVLGQADDAAHFADLAEAIKSAYHQAYFNATSGNYNDGSQMANSFPLFLGIVPKPFRNRVLGNLVNDIMNKHHGHLTTGVLGSKYMIDALAQAGRADIAYGLAGQTDYPSWGHMVRHYTTLCEFWNLKQSHNHAMMGSIDAFFYNTLAGIHIDPDHPGFEKVILRPFLPQSLAYARAAIETGRGTLASGWEKDPEGYKWTLRIPTNTTAVVEVPATDAAHVFEGGSLASESKGVTVRESGNGVVRYALESGHYEFVVREQPEKRAR